MNPARPSPIISPCTRPASTRPRPVLGSITLLRAARTWSLSGTAMRGSYPHPPRAMQAVCPRPGAMGDVAMYHQGSRELQDRFESRALADRLDERLRRERFNDADKAFVEESPFFFLATADAGGQPDC